MKVNVEVDCTPEEARAFLGLPDVSKANEAYIDKMTKVMSGADTPAQLQEFAQALAPMGQMGMKMFQSFVEGGLRAGGNMGQSAKGGSKSE